jgi:hypothetical protein
MKEVTHMFRVIILDTLKLGHYSSGIFMPRMKYKQILLISLLLKEDLDSDAALLDVKLCFEMKVSVIQITP